jgi:peptidyl-prolyl cis-trans isomerase A (cyclophilin A)
MHKLFIAILCLTGLVAAQTSGSEQHSATEKAATPKPEPTAIIQTTAGNITCTLFPNKAPIGVANFIGLATGTKQWKDPKTGKMMKGVPLYDGTIFHRVIPNFMIQGGDPAGSGSGDVGFQFKNEVSSDLTFDQAGRLAYANAGPDTNGSQFFITEGPAQYLDGKYTIFGQCQNIDVVKQIARLARDPRNDRPYDPPKITHIKIIEPGHPAGATHKPAGAQGGAVKSSAPASQQ